MKAKITALTPMLHTSDIEATIKFYTEILGFKCNEYVKDWAWAALSRDSIEITFSVPEKNKNVKDTLKAATFYFRTDNVDELWNELKDKCEIVYPVADMIYGMREFGIYDNNGHLLHFGSIINGKK